PVHSSTLSLHDALPIFRYRDMSGDIGQTQLAFGWRTPGTLHIDTPALDLLAMVLGAGRASRLYRAVRERKLASGVSAYDYTPTEDRKSTRLNSSHLGIS